MINQSDDLRRDRDSDIKFYRNTRRSIQIRNSVIATLFAIDTEQPRASMGEFLQVIRTRRHDYRLDGHQESQMKSAPMWMDSAITRNVREKRTPIEIFTRIVKSGWPRARPSFQ